jgi:hypothetical protein
VVKNESLSSRLSLRRPSEGFVGAKEIPPTAIASITFQEHLRHVRRLWNIAAEVGFRIMCG